MKVTFKTLKQQDFQLDLEESELISDVKKKVESERGSEFNATSMNLVYKGKLMEDAKALKEYNVTDKGFIIALSIAKPPLKETIPADTEKKTEPSAAAESSKPAEQPKLADTKPPVSTPAPPLAPTVPAPANVPNTGANDNSLVTGEAYEQAVAELVNMGFTHDLVVQAMRASFNNPNRAVEYLLSGNIPVRPQQPPSETETSRTENPSEEQPGSPNPDDPMAALVNLPQFQQMRALVQANPELLPQILRQIGAENSDLLQLMQENEQEFLDFLNYPADSESGEREQGEGPRQLVLTVTPDERAAIDRLKALGFAEELVIQAYYACEKNEEAAANFLLNEGLDEDQA